MLRAVVGAQSGYRFVTRARGAIAAATLPPHRFTHNGTHQAPSNDLFRPLDTFERRHIGTNEREQREMLETVGFRTSDELMRSTIPEQIRLAQPTDAAPPLSESEALAKCQTILQRNVVHKSFIGQGYYDTILPPVIQRNVLENPGWYTAYTPYQSEIAQGRLEVLLAFQTMVCDLTAMDVAGASLLDEGTAAAEAMAMCRSSSSSAKSKRAGAGARFFVSDALHPQSVDVLRTRAASAGIELVVGDHRAVDFADPSQPPFFGCVVQYPDTHGEVVDFRGFASAAKASGAVVVAASDLLACAHLRPPGEWGADIVVGSSQRLGVPLGFGGPHAGFLACTSEFRRLMPGRMIGVSKDAQGNPALRMALQTREQHIRRDKATSNICTAQALLANIATLYGIYHGPDGLRAIAHRTHQLAASIAHALSEHGYELAAERFFDTVKVVGVDARAIQRACASRGLEVRVCGPTACSVSVGESCDASDVRLLLEAFEAQRVPLDALAAASSPSTRLAGFERASPFMAHPVFHAHQTETKLLRYMKRCENADLSLVHSMIPLGSCTMKLNAASEMAPVTWASAANLHPFVPRAHRQGYELLIDELHAGLARLTGFAAMSSQPNSGAQGEYAGLLCIRKYHESRDEAARRVCLIPSSAHGTNPASAVMAGFRVVVVASDEKGNVDLADLRQKAADHEDVLGALMVTYPSTYGVFEEGIVEAIDAVHAHGGLVYMDGANMNAQCGWTSPGHVGADVCHLNLHKTFCIPHGGGGPGVGTIGVAAHLMPFLPSHCEEGEEGEERRGSGAIASAPFGSAGILPITYMYLQLMGEEGLRRATASAILNANYMAKRLEARYSVLFRGPRGQCAHEFILDIRPYKPHGVTEEDIAKRLQDYGFHAPTMSWPVAGTLMVEPTESESKAEIDRFCDALLLIHDEIDDVVEGRVAAQDSPLRHAPHTQLAFGAEEWPHSSYTRQQAAFPAPWMTMQTKFWPTVGRVDNVYGDRHLACRLPE